MTPTQPRKPIQPNGAWLPGGERAQAFARRIAEQPRVEPPPGAEARVWARLAERRSPTSRLGWALGLSATAGAFAAVLFLLARSPRVATDTSLATGEIALRSFDGSERAAIDLHGAARVVVSQPSQVALVEDDDRGMVFSLRRGSLLAEVQHRAVTAPFRVRTPRAEVLVVGTVLWVDVTAEGETTVLVAHGVVEVKPVDGAAVRVSAGERWPRNSSRAPEAADLSLLGPAALAAGGFSAPAKLDAAPSVATVLAPALAAAPHIDACSHLDRSAAVVCLERLALGGDPLRAETALYEIGWRALQQDRDARSALAAWERQRTRFPSGVLRSEADVSIIEALIRLDERARARLEIDAFLRTRPDALAAPEVHYLRGALEHLDGDCPRALAELDEALRAPAEPWATQARAERNACLRLLHQ